MSRSAPLTPSSITPVLVLALATACGHTDLTLDAYEKSKLLALPTAPGPGGAGGYEEPPDLPFLPFTCDAAGTQQYDPSNMKPYSVSAEDMAKVENAMRTMGPAEKAQQMMGIDGSDRNYRDIERSPDVEVPGLGTVRGYRYRDAGRGVNLDAGQDNRIDDKRNFATVFPTASTRAASWDVRLERRIGVALGDETAGSRNNMMLAPCMNIIRHPYWGRTQETYGEDMYHIGRMATALTVGIQEYVVACAKHFAVNNIERWRAKQNAVLDEQTLREIYGRHFEMTVQDGAIGCIMASYNLVNDIKATQNTHLLRNVLKAPLEQGGMGYQGFVLTDWWAMPGDQNVPDSGTAQAVATQAVTAGLDVEVPWALNYTVDTLRNADQGLVDEAARRVLTQKFRFGSAMDGDLWGLKPATSTLTEGSITPHERHEALAEEAAVKSAVLLKNGAPGAPVLPLTAATTIAVVGIEQFFTQVSSSVPKSCGYSEDTGQGQTATKECTFRFATDPSLGDRGSSRVNGDPARSYGPFKGIQQIAGAGRTVTSGTTVADTAAADTVVVVVGYTPGDEGEEYYISEGGDRKSLDLPPGHNELVAAVLDQNKPTVIIVQSGSIVNLPWLSHSNQNQATIWAGYPGMRGGLALGKLIFGQANFSGKMPMAWAAESDLFPFKDSDTITTMGYFFGYRLYDKRKYVDLTPVNLVFPFGYGLSYSTFEYSNLVVPCTQVPNNGIVGITVDVTNSSAVDGDEVVMLFVKPPPAPEGTTGQRPWKELKSFARVSVPAGQTVPAQLPLRINDLRRWEGDGTTGRWVIDPGAYTILVGKNAEDAETSTLVGTVTLNGG